MNCIKCKSPREENRPPNRARFDSQDVQSLWELVDPQVCRRCSMFLCEMLHRNDATQRELDDMVRLADASTRARTVI